MQTEKTTKPITKHFISRYEFSEATGLSIPSIANYIAAGTIKAVRVGRRVLIPFPELQRLEREAGGEAA